MNTEHYKAAARTETGKQFRTRDGRPTLILGDNRSEAEKLRCAQVQIDSDRDTITYLRSHADKLAEALRAWEYAGNEGGISMADWFEVARKKTREALAAYEAAQ